MKSERPAARPSRPSRGTASVIMLGSACRRHSASTALPANFPVPWIRRERRLTPPMTSGSVSAWTSVAIRPSPASAAAHEMDDLNHVARAQGLIEALTAPVDDAVELDHNALGENLEAPQEIAHAPEPAQGHWIAINGHGRRCQRSHRGTAAGAAR